MGQCVHGGGAVKSGGPACQGREGRNVRRLFSHLSLELNCLRRNVRARIPPDSLLHNSTQTHSGLLPPFPKQKLNKPGSGEGQKSEMGVQASKG